VPGPENSAGGWGSAGGTRVGSTGHSAAHHYLNRTTGHWDGAAQIEQTRAVRSERNRARSEDEEQAGCEARGLQLRSAPLRPNGDGLNRQ